VDAGRPEDPIRPRRRRRDIGALAAAGWIGLVIFAAVFADLLPLPDPAAVTDKFNAGPGLDGRLLGTDKLGRDALSRLVFGARISMAVAVAAQPLP
jgi:peptide/nickel transport system permease protein